MTRKQARIVDKHYRPARAAARPEGQRRPCSGGRDGVVIYGPPEQPGAPDATTDGLRRDQEVLIYHGRHRPTPGRIVYVIDGQFVRAIRTYPTSGKTSKPFVAHAGAIIVE